MDFGQLQKAPFNLDDEALNWVKTTLAGMSLEQKVAQTFVLISRTTDAEELETLARLQPGGITRLLGPDMQAELDFMAQYASVSDLPPIVSADLEGSRMGPPFGTKLPNALGVSALDDLQATRQVSRIMAEEGRAAGIAWSFTPVIDINAAFRSAIVGTRSFGSDLERIERHALTQIETFQANGVAATAKHWPGEGFDDRDQHLVTTINPLDLDEWEKSFGRLYRKAIEAGVMSVMSGHIALPSYMRSLDPDCGVEAFRPASINKALNIGLLREKLGFNGLIVSDATSMAGLGSWCGYDEAMPALLENGCDVILFSNDPETDMGNVQKAVESGRIPMERLDEAVMRLLGLKAAQGLHKAPLVEPETAPGRFRKPENLAISADVMQRTPTLVKDVQNLLPLDPKAHRRVLVFTNNITFPFLPEPLPFDLPGMLEKEGFEVTLFTPGMEVKSDAFDLVLYLLGDESLLTRSHIFVDWLKITGFFGDAMKRFWHDIPTAMISFGHPYYLYDAPRVPTYINAYSTLPEMQAAVVECLLGRAPWNRSNPVDPFCGLEDARF